MTARFAFSLASGIFKLMPPELHTIRDFLRYAASRFNEAHLFFGHGTDNAWDEAIALILHALHLPYDIHPSALDATLIQQERITLFALIEKRITERLPVPYLTHEAWFAGLSFYVDQRTLIPRSPLAESIHKQFEPWLTANQKINKILDIGTGCGCIAIACAKAFANATIDATDLSEAALAVAKINLLRHHVENRVILHHANLFDGLPKQAYDIIISNPPYVSQADIATLPEEYHWEPLSALQADDGLECVQRILKDAYHYLSPQGLLIVEIGEQIERLTQLFPTLPFTWLTFEQGEGEVFLLHRHQLKQIAS